jgi:hypothetical protein
MPENLVENQTAPVQQQLFRADPPGSVPGPFNLAGAVVELEMRDIDGVLAPTTGDITVDDPALGKVSYTPDVGDFTSLAGLYYARWKVTMGVSVDYWPNAEPDPWTVRQ